MLSCLLLSYVAYLACGLALETQGMPRNNILFIHADGFDGRSLEAALNAEAYCSPAPIKLPHLSKLVARYPYNPTYARAHIHASMYTHAYKRTHTYILTKWHHLAKCVHIITCLCPITLCDVVWSLCT